jgi:hypothetical protein
LRRRNASRTRHGAGGRALQARARGGQFMKNWFCSTFGRSLIVPRCRMKNARNARFTYEKCEWRLIRIDQMKSMISEF